MTEISKLIIPGENAPEQHDFLIAPSSDAELIIGLVGATGTDLRGVANTLEEQLKRFNYEVRIIVISTDVIPKTVPTGHEENESEFDRIRKDMDAGNFAREKSEDDSILSLGVAGLIFTNRAKDLKTKQRSPFPRRAYIIKSLKHPEEVKRLREIYPEGFYLLGVHADEQRRKRSLMEDRSLSAEEASILMDRDEDEKKTNGQRTRDTFQLSDFFIYYDEDTDKLKYSIWRITDLLFGDPYITPTFDEYAMFMAFSASLRSADLSRQVGAVIAKEDEIIANGANDCPKKGGGLYWPEYNNKTKKVEDVPKGRDHTRKVDSNEAEQKKIINDIMKSLEGKIVNTEFVKNTLEQSGIGDLTEYGRVVHAEMEALLMCARNSTNTRGATLYCTTFPCHNCAKHIVASGIKRVVFVEPYPKSKATKFHNDSITLGFNAEAKKVHFEPFVGVGPRRFFDLFSMKLGSGYPLKRKNDEGETIKWYREVARLRIQMLPCSYIDMEKNASSQFERFREKMEFNNGE